MMSVMGTSKDSSVESPSGRGKSAVGEERTVASTTAGGSDGLSIDGKTEGAARVSVASNDGLEERSVNDPGVLKPENEVNILGDASGGEIQLSSSVSRMHGNRKMTGFSNEQLDHKRNRSVVQDYDSILSAFYEFAAKEEGDAVGHGYKIGDMVWGKVKSHPWWPGHIYNEAFASPSVWRSKHNGHVLVAFFGDSSYGWFDPAELIPFEENFAEKSKQTMSRTFLKAVEEAADELSRRISLGLACRCRNEFNFWPSNINGYLVVDVGDYEPGVYSLSQISKSRDSFWPREMLSFIQQLALEPTNDQHGDIELIKNKATVLACRKALFEEFYETYAQAFGTVQVRPPRPTAPATVDPSKAPLSGRLVIAEAIGKGKIYVKPVKTKDQAEKDKYLFKGREESIQMKRKKASSGQWGHSPRPLLVDGSGFSDKVMYSGKGDNMHQPYESCITDGLHQHQAMSHQASISRDINPSEGSKKLVEGGTRKDKILKQPAAGKKKKKKVGSENGEKFGQLPVAVSSNNAFAVENVSGTPLHVLQIDSNEQERVVGSLSCQSQLAVDVDIAKVELQMLVTDLRALALNPFHGEERCCPAVIRQVFLKYRSLVYQKSLVLSPPSENEAIDRPADKTNDHQIMKKPLDGPTKGGKKRGSSDQVEDVKRKKKKIDVLSEVKEKKANDSKSSVSERKITPKTSSDLKEIFAKNVRPTQLPKLVKLEMEQVVSPTMLVMKFPAGAALPSGSELRAKFARFGPLDHTATRIFWKSYTCRLVYLHKVDAQEALTFAIGSSNLFGNANVRCHLRELEVEVATESEPVKLHKEDVSQSRDPAVEQKIAAQPHNVQLKSCLRKPPSGDEGGNGGRGAVVKFVDESVKVERLLYKSKNDIACFPVQGASSVHSLNISSSKILPKLNPQSSNTHTPSGHFQKFDVKMPNSTPQLPGGCAPINDISQHMLNLLMRCNDVVNNLTSVLGYVPYHPL